MESGERSKREHERVLRTRERLRFRVYAAVRGVVLGTELFRTHPSLFEPDVVINVYPHLVDVQTSLNEGQLRLVPANRRSVELNRFAEELRAGMEKVATDLDLEFTSAATHFGGSQPVMLVDVPTGYRAVLLRRDPE